jgi:hypothetical protein
VIPKPVSCHRTASIFDVFDTELSASNSAPNGVDLSLDDGTRLGAQSRTFNVTGR